MLTEITGCFTLYIKQIKLRRIPEGASSKELPMQLAGGLKLQLYNIAELAVGLRAQLASLLAETGAGRGLGSLGG